MLRLQMFNVIINTKIFDDMKIQNFWLFRFTEEFLFIVVTQKNE